MNIYPTHRPDPSICRYALQARYPQRAFMMMTMCFGEEGERCVSIVSMSGSCLTYNIHKKSLWGVLAKYTIRCEILVDREKKTDLWNVKILFLEIKMASHLSPGPYGIKVPTLGKESTLEDSKGKIRPGDSPFTPIRECPSRIQFWRDLCKLT